MNQFKKKKSTKKTPYHFSSISRCPWLSSSVQCASESLPRYSHMCRYSEIKFWAFSALLLHLSLKVLNLDFTDTSIRLRTDRRHWIQKYPILLWFKLPQLWRRGFYGKNRFSINLGTQLAKSRNCQSIIYPCYYS